MGCLRRGRRLQRIYPPGSRLGPWPAAGISFAVGFTVRVTALYKGWQVPLAKEPTGVYRHSDGRPLLGRKIAGKSVREMKDLGLMAEPTETEKG